MQPSPHAHPEQAGDPEGSFPRPWVRAVGPGAWRLEVWAQPGAKRSEATGVQDGRLRVRVAAPAVEGKANRALLKFLSERLNVKLAQLELSIGESARRKSVLVRSEREPDWRAFEVAL
jgi:uncharacterized protein (TIGR00251 family)